MSELSFERRVDLLRYLIVSMVSKSAPHSRLEGESIHQRAY